MSDLRTAGLFTSGFGLASGVRFSWLGTGTVSLNATESVRQTNIRSAGVFSSGFYRCSANAAGTSTLQLRIATANGNVAVSITASTVGFFEDTTHTDTVTAGQAVNWQITNGGGGSITTTMMGVNFAATTNTVAIWIAGILATSASSTVFSSPVNNGTTPSATETDVSIKVPVAGTWRNLQDRMLTVRTTTTVVTSRIDGVSGNQTISVSGTGLTEDTTHSDTVSIDQKLAIMTVTDTGTGNHNGAHKSEFETTGSVSLLVQSADATGISVASQTDLYLTIMGILNGSVVGGGSETVPQLNLRAAPTLSKFRANFTVNGVTLTTVVRFRINTVSGNLVISLTSGGATGWFEDASNSDTVAATDQVNLFYDGDAADAGTSSKIMSTAIKVNFGGGAAAASQPFLPGGYRPRFYTPLRKVA